MTDEGGEYNDLVTDYELFTNLFSCLVLTVGDINNLLSKIYLLLLILFIFCLKKIYFFLMKFPK